MKICGFWLGRWMGLASLVLFTGCAVGPDYVRPVVAQPAAYYEHSPWKNASPRDEIAKGNWYSVFHDAQLDALEDQAQQANQNLRAALARVGEFRASARETEAAFFPNLSLDPAANRNRLSPNDGERKAAAPSGTLKAATYNAISIPFDLSYEVDLWGRIRRSFESANASAQASVADYENVLLTLKSDVATTYFAVRTGDAQIDVQERSIKARQDELDLTQVRFKGGISTDLDVQQALAELASAQAQLGSLKQNRALLLHALAVLTGQAPEGFALAPHPLDLEPPRIPPGMPSELLERRPDVATAERRVAAQNAQIGVAIAAYFPVVRLTGDLGLDSGDIGTVFNWNSHVWSLGPNITLPIFEGGQISANVRRQRAAYEESVANYRQQVLVAFQDVEDSLSNLRYLSEQAEAQERAYQAYTKTLDLTTQRYRGGLVSYFDVTLAERNQLQAEQTKVQIAGNRIASSVRLIKALGGGWADSSLAGTRKIVTNDGAIAPKVGDVLPTH